MIHWHLPPTYPTEHQLRLRRLGRGDSIIRGWWSCMARVVVTIRLRELGWDGPWGGAADMTPAEDECRMEWAYAEKWGHSRVVKDGTP